MDVSGQLLSQDKDKPSRAPQLTQLQCNPHTWL